MKNKKLSFYLPSLLSLFVITSICFDCTDASLLTSEQYAPPTDTEYLSIRPAELFTIREKSGLNRQAILRRELLRRIEVTCDLKKTIPNLNRDEGWLLMLDFKNRSEGPMLGIGCIGIIYEKKLLNSCCVCVAPGTNF